MNLQDLKKKPAEEKRPEQKPEGQKLGKTAQKRLIIAAAVFFFLIPSHAAVSSVSGLAERGNQPQD